MTSIDFFASHLAATPVVAIFRGRGAEATVALAHRAWEAGVDLVEVPVQTPEAVAAFEAVVAEGRAFGKAVGAGTVLTVAQVETVAAAGGAFAVAPGFDRDVVRAAAEIGLPFLPGTATVSEALAVLETGHTAMKFFPAGPSGGAAYLGSLPTVIPEARFCPPAASRSPPPPTTSRSPTSAASAAPGSPPPRPSPPATGTTSPPSPPRPPLCAVEKSLPAG